MTATHWLMLLGALIAVVPLGALAPKGIELLNAKAKGARFEYVVNLLAEAARVAVLEVETTLKPKLVAALQDGVLTDTEKAALKAAAMQLLLSRLPVGVVAMAKGVFGPALEAVLAKNVEAAVLTMKATGIAEQVRPAAVPDAKPTPSLRAPFLPAP